MEKKEYHECPLCDYLAVCTGRCINSYNFKFIKFDCGKCGYEFVIPFSPSLYGRGSRHTLWDRISKLNLPLEYLPKEE